MFTGRRPRAFQFDCCVGTAILGQAYCSAQDKGSVRRIRLRGCNCRGGPLWPPDRRDKIVESDRAATSKIEREISMRKGTTTDHTDREPICADLLGKSV